MTELPEILTPEQVADWLKLRPSTIRSMAREGRIPCVKFGRAVRFLEPEISEWVEKQREDQAA